MRLSKPSREVFQTLHMLVRTAAALKLAARRAALSRARASRRPSRTWAPETPALRRAARGTGCETPAPAMRS